MERIFRLGVEGDPAIAVVVMTSSAAPRRRGGRPSVEEVRLLDRRLIEVATALFAERGFHGTSMEAVAAAAGVGKMSIYARFADKDALFGAVLAALHRPQVGEEMLPPPGLSVKEGLLHIAIVFLADVMHANTISFYRIMQREGGRSPQLLAAFRGWRGPAIAVMNEYFGGLRRDGRIVDIDPETVSALFYLYIGSDFSNRMLNQLDVPTREELLAFLEPACAIFARGLAIEPDPAVPDVGPYRLPLPPG